MKDEEQKYLEFEKVNSGKSLEQARLEIKLLKISQQGFKALKREVTNLEKEIEKKDKLINKLQKSHFKNILPETRTIQKSIEIKESKNEEATLKDLNRIITLINAEKKIGLSDLSKTCVVSSKKVKGALNFLIRNNFVREVMDGSKLILEKVE